MVFYKMGIWSCYFQSSLSKIKLNGRTGSVNSKTAKEINCWWTRLSEKFVDLQKHSAGMWEIAGTIVNGKKRKKQFANVFLIDKPMLATLLHTIWTWMQFIFRPVDQNYYLATIMLNFGCCVSSQLRSFSYILIFVRWRILCNLIFMYVMFPQDVAGVRGTIKAPRNLAIHTIHLWDPLAPSHGSQNAELSWQLFNKSTSKYTYFTRCADHQINPRNL